MEPELRLLRSSDCLRPPELPGEPHLLDHRRRPPRPQLLLDSASPDGSRGSAHRGLGQRPHLEPLRPPPPLPLSGRRHRHHRHVPAPQRRLAQPLRQLRHHLRPHHAHVPRHLDQHGHAALQDARRRLRQRKTERPGLFHPVLPLQRRLCGRLCLPHRPGHVPGQHRPGGRGARNGHLVVLHRRRRPGPLRALHHGESQGDAPARVCRIPRPAL